MLESNRLDRRVGRARLARHLSLAGLSALWFSLVSCSSVPVTGVEGHPQGEQGFESYCGEDELWPCDCVLDVSKNGQTCHVKLDCFCDTLPCRAGDDPFGEPPDERYSDGYVKEYADCGLALYEICTENPCITHLVDLTSGEVLGASYTDDSGLCGDGTAAYAGEPIERSLEGCEVTSCTPLGRTEECPE